jgi:hypothetical protein
MHTLSTYVLIRAMKIYLGLVSPRSYVTESVIVHDKRVDHSTARAYVSASFEDPNGNTCGIFSAFDSQEVLPL